jgi:hypothetical protein
MQRAFESGSFVASQSALILGTPLLSILVGTALYGVTVTHSWWRQLGGVLCGVGVVVAIGRLLRSPLLIDGHDARAVRLSGSGLLKRRRDEQRPHHDGGVVDG